MVWQLVLWVDDLKAIDMSTTDMWGVMDITWKNFFGNTFYEGFKPALLFVPFYSMLALALPYVMFIYDVTD